MLKKLSLMSDHHSHKMSCIITRKGKIIGKGSNSLATHPESNHAFKCKHAEFNAFISAHRDIKDSTVYVFRENRNGQLSQARPCPSCYALLMAQGAKRIIYTFEGSYKEEEL